MVYANTQRTSEQSRLKKNKVLLLCASTYIAGTERVVQSLARGLSARHIAVETVIPWEINEADRITKTIEWHRQSGVEVKASKKFSRKNTGWHNLWTLANFIKTYSDVEIVNIHYTQNTSVSLTDILAIRLAGKKPVVMVHHPTSWQDIGTRQYQIIKIALNLSDAVVGSTECMAKLLKQAGVKSHKIVTIPLGVEPHQKKISREDARNHFGIPQNAFVISTLARLVAEKGIFELIEAFLRLPDSSNPGYLIVAGDGPDRAALEQKAGEYLGKTIIFPGRVKDVSEVYAVADVFALPSHWEGFGLVYVEAAFYGLPSIGTNVGGIPYVISNDETGLLVPPSDVFMLTSAILRLRDQEGYRHRLGNAAYERACTEFTEEKMAQRFLDLFHNLSTSKPKYSH